MKEMYTPKAKRRRVNAAYRWREAVTLDFILRIVDAVESSPELFEKPTSQVFYENVALSSPKLKSIPWRCMKNKMRYCKNLYFAASKWKHETGVGLLADGETEKVSSYIKRLCPYFDELHKVFGQIEVESHESHTGDIESSNASTDFLDIHTEIKIEGTSIQYSDQSPDADSDGSLNDSLQDKLPGTSSMYNPCKEEPQKCFSKSPSPANNACPELMKLQERTLELEIEKFQWKKEKEKKELQQQFELKKLETEIKERLERENLDKQERVEKYELELKYKFLRDFYN